MAFLLLAGTMPGACGMRPANTLPNGEPLLRMPFPAGTVVVCLQGNRSAEGHSHFGGDNLYALDFTTPNPDHQEVVAAADGEVAYVTLGLKVPDRQSRPSLGNLVKVDHGQGYYTLYTHLDTVAVKLGDKVKCGQTLGIMGNVGSIPGEDKYVHFSLHRADARQAGVSPAVPIHALIAVDLQGAPMTKLMAGPEFIGADDRRSQKEGLYGSENRGSSPLPFGPPPADLAATLSASVGSLLKQPPGKELY